MDPPYADPAIQTVLARIAESGLLAPQGLLVVGHATAVQLPDAPGSLQRMRQKIFGGSAFSLYKHASAGELVTKGNKETD